MVMRTKALLLPLLLIAKPAFAQAVPVTGEILISVSDTTSRLRPDVAADPSGRFVVVWREVAGQDGGIAGRRLNALGALQGTGFLVKPPEERLYTTDPKVACREDGSFLAAWGEASFPNPGCAKARSLTADDTGGDAFDLGPCAGGAGRAPSVALAGLRDGRSSVAWEVGEAFAPSALDVVLRAFPVPAFSVTEPRRVDAGGAAGPVSETAPALAVDVRGRSIAAWIQSGSGALFARQFDPAGAPLSEPFRVDAGDGFALKAAVAAAPDGRFVAVWSAYLGGGNRLAILGRLFDRDGRAPVLPFLVSSADGPPREQNDPDVAMDANGNFVVVWDAEGVDGTGTGVLGRLFTAAGAPQGEPFRINLTGRGSQGHPAVTWGRTGRFLVVWDSQKNAAGRGSIVGRLYAASAAVLP